MDRDTNRVALYYGVDSVAASDALGGELRDALAANGFTVRQRKTVSLTSIIRTGGDVGLVVVTVGKKSEPGEVVRSALLARRHSIPLLVVESEPGVLDSLLIGRFGNAVTNRAVTRILCAEPLTEQPPSSMPHDLLNQIGAGPLSGCRDGLSALSLADLQAVAEVHMAAFNESAMTQLGAKVVERYYRWQFIGPHPSPHATGFYRDGKLEGFLFGGQRKDAASGFARRFLPTIISACIVRPKGAAALLGPELVKVLRLMIRRSPTSRPARSETHAQPEAGASMNASGEFAVLSIAVRPDCQGTGIGARLMAEAEETAVHRGFEQMRLSVDVDNQNGIRFYEYIGWQKVSGESGGWEGRMTKSISTSNP